MRRKKGLSKKASFIKKTRSRAIQAYERSDLKKLRDCYKLVQKYEKELGI